MNRLKRFLPIEIMRVIYNSLVLPHFQYSILNWGFKVSRLAKLQKKAVRIVSCSRYNAHTEPIFKSLKLLKISDILKLNILKMYFKFYHKLLPTYLSNMFLQNDSHGYNLRASYVLKVPKCRTNYVKQSIRFMLPNVINSADSCVIDKVQTHCYSGFGYYFKHKTIDEYSNQCIIVNCYICNRP